MPTDSTDTTAPAEPEAPPAHSNRFFTWMRATGVVRQPGWIGGVCAGIADRLGIDPLIVRGIAVVVAVLGGPAILLYAAAWLLLPDRFDRIHLEQLFRGKVDAPIAAIGVLIILSLLPVTQGFWSIGAAYWQGGATLGRVIWTVVLLAVIVGVIVWVARRAERTAAREKAASAAATDVAPEAQAADVAADAATPTTVIAPLVEPESAPSVAPTAVEPPTATLPLEPAPDAPAEDFTAWREQQAALKAETDAFKAQQAATNRELAAQRAEELRREREAIAAGHAERRRAKRAANPRLSAAWVFLILGCALVAGGIGALLATVDTTWGTTVGVAGLAAAALTVGIGIVIAGAARRRSGFLSFVGIVLVVILVPLSFVPADRQLIGASYGLGPGSYAQVAGSTDIVVQKGETGVIDLWQGAGNVTIFVSKGASAQLMSVQRAGSYDEMTRLGNAKDGSGIYGSAGIAPSASTADGHQLVRDIGKPAAGALQIRLWQGSGSVDIQYIDPESDAPGKKGKN